MADIKIRRTDVINFINSSKQNFGWCEWCKHYQNLNTCSECYNNSRYSLDWRNFYQEHKQEIDDYIRK